MIVQNSTLQRDQCRGESKPEQPVVPVKELLPVRRSG